MESPTPGLPVQNAETYLGDGLFARFDGYHIILRAPRLGDDHFVALEPSSYQCLRSWIDRFPRLKAHMDQG